MRIGIILPLGETAPDARPGYAGVRALALQAEAAGLDSVWVYDHLLAEGVHDAEQSPWEAWTVLSAVAEATTSVRLGTLVLCTSFRNAGVLARMADTLQEVSGDRLVLGLGSGWHEPEYTAFGMPFADRVDGFAEAVRVICGMLRDGRATVTGRHHTVVDAPVRARPGRVPPEILIASVRPRMMRLTAQHADAWNLAWFGHPSSRWRSTSGDLDRACEAVGRDPAAVRRTAGVLVHLAPPEPDDRLVPIGGSPQSVAEGLRAWEAEGVDEVVLSLDPPTPACTDLMLAGVAAFRG